MSAIFLSHSSADNKIAGVIRQKLLEAGHRSIFLDFDPSDGIPAGRDWEQELYHQLRACQAVIVLCSDHSMNSPWCFAEITHAKSLGKPIFPIKIAPCTINTVLTSRQVLDFTTGATVAMDRLRRGLKSAGLDPASAFDWDGSRPPYPGLLAFDERDAAIYFGRDVEIQQGLELLNGRRQFGGPRMVVVLGASGSGKSSLVRAGLIPRLRRSECDWIVVDPFRPRADPFQELAAVLEAALKRYDKTESCQGLCEGLAAGGSVYAGAATVTKVLKQIRAAACQRDATALITIDQMEELLNPEAVKAAPTFLAVLQTAAMDPDASLILIATLRSDFLAEFQNHPAMRDARFDTFPVGPISLDHMADVIVSPARKAGLELEDGLAEMMAADTEQENALPLLAFALRDLYENFGRDGRLTIEEYKTKSGGLTGSVARAANLVFDAQKLSEAQESELRRVFLDMVQVNHDGQYVRQPAHWTDVPEGVKPAVEAFINARLLSARNEGSERIIEVAHEAIFRSWDRLKTWLAHDREFLLWHKRLEDSCAEWRRVRRDPSALLKGPALSEARRWFEMQRSRLPDEEKQFVAASIEAANRERLRARTLAFAVIAVLGIIAAGGLLLWRRADGERKRAEGLVASLTQAQKAKTQAEAEVINGNVKLAWASLAEPVCSPAASGTYISGGIRGLYCLVSPFINIRRLGELAAMPIFTSGPHTAEAAALHAGTFGRYNPAFVRWAVDHLIIDQTKDTQQIYDKFVRRTARVFLMAYDYLQSHPNNLERLEREYRTKGALPQFYVLNTFDSFVRSVDQDPDVAPTPTGKPPSDESPIYYADTAIAFWARRSIDGTAPLFYEGLTNRLMRQFDPKFLESRSRIGLTKPAP